ncbi:Ribosome quality control complex subunit 1 [Exophiala dermatitidis]
MAPRALRKLQREQELQRQVAAAQKTYDEDTEESEEEQDAEEGISTPSRPTNAFDMLEQVENEEPSDTDEGETTAQPAPSAHSPDDIPRASEVTAVKSKSKKKKKKAKGKKKDSSKAPTPAERKDESEDEIDRALKELAIKDAHGRPATTDSQQTPDWEATATRLLAVDSHNFNPTNEMKSLFGNIALEGQESRSAPRNQRRREQNLQGGVDLATALTGRYCVASKGKELGSLAHRRNVFVQGKEEWPLATSGGLSMEHVPDPTTFEKRYNIMHNNLYRETQMHFLMAVESMDPQKMVGLLSMYPYHIATLLQVSEIAKHQGDHAVSGDLIERALYTFGKSVHSSFPASMRSGVARVPFEKPANRELYLAIWRYIRNLEMRGTWRTAFEWAKLLLQLNTKTDPYGVTLMIDQLALRGRQHAQLIELCSDDGYGPSWDFLPNIQISLALAYHRAGRPRDAREQLAVAMHKYPYILSALATALDISPLPKALWAKLPSTDAEKLHTQLYVTRAKDLWNTPETISLLVEVAETLSHYRAAIASAPPAPTLEISLEEARHIMLLEIPALIALLPRRFTSMPTSSFDVLPPPDSLSDFVFRAPAAARRGDGTMQTIFNAAGATAGATGSLLQRIMSWFQTPAGPGDVDGESEGQAALRNLQEQLGGDVPPEMIEQLLQIHLDEATDQDQQGVNPAGLGMAGGWDYYEEADQNNPTEDDDADSMPDLEPISDDEEQPQQPQPSASRNPRAATVEEDEAEDEAEHGAAQSSRGTLGRAVLRHVDSDDEEDGGEPAATTTGAQQRTQPQSAAAPDTASADQSTQFSDPQRVQRWLLTAGLTDLQSNPDTLDTYVSRLKSLRKPQQDWVVNMVRQRAGPDLEARVRRAMG